MTFDEWYEANERRFYTGHMNTREVAIAAWYGGREESALPDLLEALGKLADEAERVLLVEQDYERDLPHLRLAFVKAQAAIAEAGGEA